ncbi:MAG: ABC transporter ATP-binding protein [Planctomycetota bacterium]
MIRLEDVEKTYHLGEVDVRVLRGVTLSIEHGEMVAIMGSSGSGKSTLLNILGCLDRPSAGKYWLDGIDVSEMSRDQRALIRNEKIGFCFQNFNLLARTTALENVMMPMSYSFRDTSEREWQERAEQLLERVGLKDRMDHEPSQLSGGQQQRVAIARALINNPPVLLADEPTGALDSRTSEEILQLFEELHAEQGITVILVTHDAEVGRHAQRVIRVHDGKIESSHNHGKVEGEPVGAATRES